MVAQLEQADQTHLRVAGFLEVFHGAACVLGLAAGMGKQLDGGDVGVGIGHTARHHGSRIGLLLANLAQTRHKVPAGQGIAEQPDAKGQQQVGIKTASQQQDADEVHAHADQHIDHDEDHLTHSQRGLHDLGGDASGKLVCVERHALAQHQPVEHPAHAHGKVDRQHLVHDHGVQGQQHDGAQQDGCNAEQTAALHLPELCHRRGRQPVHHAAHHAKQKGFIDGQQGAGDGHQHNPAAHAARAGPQKGDKARGRQLGLVRGIGGNAFFKKSEQAVFLLVRAMVGKSLDL